MSLLSRKRLGSLLAGRSLSGRSLAGRGVDARNGVTKKNGKPGAPGAGGGAPATEALQTDFSSPAAQPWVFW